MSLELRPLSTARQFMPQSTRIPPLRAPMYDEFPALELARVKNVAKGRLPPEYIGGAAFLNKTSPPENLKFYTAE